MTAVSINVYMVMFNMCITTLACFNGCTRTATGITAVTAALQLWVSPRSNEEKKSNSSQLVKP